MPAESEQYYSHLQYLTGRLVEFLSQQNNNIPAALGDLQKTYTESGEYLMYVTQYHHTSNLVLFILDLVERISPGDSIIDVGCSSGFSGLTLARYGCHNVTFHDYAGLGLEFIAWYAKQEGLPLKTIPYANPTEARYNWVLCMDVLEHTGNHLGTLKWLESLGDNVALCYPLMRYDPPYIQTIDQWVDDDAIQWIITKRYTVLDTKIVDGRRYTIYRTK